MACTEKSNGPGNTLLTFWSVGQGDFASITTSDSCLFFDIGGNRHLSKTTLHEIRNRCSGKINLLLISHFDLDHIRNYSLLLKTVQISTAYFSHLDPKTKFGRVFLKTLSENKIGIKQIDDHFSQNNKSYFLKCLWPSAEFKHFRGENDYSLVFQFNAGGRSVLFTGDLPSTIEKLLPSTHAEILKVGHHGSKTSSSQKFLDNLHPKECIVSVGSQNPYGHPTFSTLTRLSHAHCTILRTDRLGSVNFIL